MMMNGFQPSVKLVSKKSVGSRLRRQYNALQTPLDRLIQSTQGMLLTRMRCKNSVRARIHSNWQRLLSTS